MSIPLGHRCNEEGKTVLSICHLAKQGFEEHKTKLKPLIGRRLELASITLLTTKLVKE